MSEKIGIGELVGVEHNKWQAESGVKTMFSHHAQPATELVEKLREELLTGGVVIKLNHSSNASLDVFGIDKKETTYKVELIITTDDKYPEQNKSLDDILFDALGDAPFRMDMVTINKIDTVQSNEVQEKYDEVKDVNELLCVLKENEEEELIAFVKDCYMHKTGVVHKVNNTNQFVSYYAIFPPMAEKWTVIAINYYNGKKTIYDSKGKHVVEYRKGV